MGVIQGGNDKGQGPGSGGEGAGLGVGPKDGVYTPACPPAGAGLRLTEYTCVGGSAEYLLYFFFPITL